MKLLTPASLGKVAGWVASVGIALYALLHSLVAITYFWPCDEAQWANWFAMYFGYVLAVVALNPLSWRLSVFGSPVLRIVLAACGLALAYAMATWFAPESHLQGAC
jgi:hypothetical protein